MKQSPNKNNQKKKQNTFQLKTKLVWLIALRVILTSILLGATLVVNFSTVESFNSPVANFLLALIAVTYVVSIIFSIWHKFGKFFLLSARLQIFIDLIIWGCLAYATGGIISGFTVLFDLWVIVAGVIIGKKAPYHAAAAASIILIAMAFLMESGVLGSLEGMAETSLTKWEFVYFTGVNTAGLFIVAALVTSLVSRIENVGYGLEIEREMRADLATLHSDTLRSLTVGLATTDMSCNIVEINPSGLNILNMLQNDVLGSNISRWIPDLKDLEKTDDSKITNIRTTGITGDNTKFPVRYTLAPLLSADGTRRGNIVVFEDLTLLLNLEDKLQSSKRLAALGELAAGLAHEIRNPLGAISGSFQMFKEQDNSDEKNKPLLKIITRELTRLENLVEDMLRFVKPVSLHPVEANLTRLLTDILSTFQNDPQAAGIKIDSEIKDNLSIKIDTSGIKQVVWNLMRNACQAVEEDGKIKVVAFDDGEKIIIRILDNGPGIDVKDIEKIFSPFFSRRKLGLGLGLSLCKKIVQDHKGRIIASNKANGTGAEFRIELIKNSSEQS